MELLPLGPVLFIDTAGIDDVGALGELRARRTLQVFDRTDLGVIVTEVGAWGEFEDRILAELRQREINACVVFNKIDTAHGCSVMPAHTAQKLADMKVPVVAVSALHREGILDLRQTLLESAPEHFIENPAILGDLVGPDGLAVLVVPVDKEAPRGRLILPQVQAIRDLLDADAMALVVKERELRTALERLSQPPRLVVTDSQAFLKVAADTPRNVPLTSFSILFARFKGDLAAQVEGALAVEDLRPGDRVLIAEACSHHPIADDIGRVKIPRWLNQYVGGRLEFDTVQGHDFPVDLSPYSLVVHCGACTFNRRAMLTRILRCRRAGVPITNYGLAIAYSLGIFERALEPFPAAIEILRAASGPLSGLRRGRGDRCADGPMSAELSHETILGWLRETDPDSLNRCGMLPTDAGARRWGTMCICEVWSRSPTTASACAATVDCGQGAGGWSATA
jgi:[FeFe] hydrogenase H-cluster maturation GTPase HydF